MANEKNLIPNSERTPSELRENTLEARTKREKKENTF